jgi:hypothetical protein
LLVPQDRELRAAAIHAHAVDTGRGWKITKGSTGSFVDQVVALSMACLAATTSQVDVGQPAMQFKSPVIVTQHKDTGAVTVFGAPQDQKGPPAHYTRAGQLMQQPEPWRPWVGSWGIRTDDKLY